MNFKLIENGVEREYELLFTFMSPDTGNNYAVYTDNVEDAEGHLTRYTGICDPNSAEFNVLPITSPLEQAIVDDALEDIRRQLEAAMEGLGQ
ncbi:MAG: DUF1292 domain-containing protein [Oscillospiraceae bacterium]|nr:DUF1292 domain-containing protein [Oscillospiraceae bacterium]